MSTEKIKKRQFNPDGLEGRVTSDGSDLNSVKDNLSAVAAPTGSDDSSAGYSVSSMWLYAGKFYRCRDASVGAAVWESISVSGHTHAASDINSGILATARGGVPTGGTTGQLLTKQSAADVDVDWESPTINGLGDFCVLTPSTQSTTNSSSWSVMSWSSSSTNGSTVTRYATNYIQVSEAGVYLVTVNTCCSIDSSGADPEMKIVKNSSTDVTGSLSRSEAAANNIDNNMSIIVPVALAANDYLHVAYRNASSGTTWVRFNSFSAASFTVTRLV